MPASSLKKRLPAASSTRRLRRSCKSTGRNCRRGRGCRGPSPFEAVSVNRRQGPNRFSALSRRSDQSEYKFKAFDQSPLSATVPASSERPIAGRLLLLDAVHCGATHPSCQATNGIQNIEMIGRRACPMSDIVERTTLHLASRRWVIVTIRI